MNKERKSKTMYAYVAHDNLNELCLFKLALLFQTHF